jgi:hypothetical protein
MKTTKTKTVSIKPVAKSSKPRELAPIQQLISDEIADLLVHGGCASAVDSLLMAAGSHSAWRWAMGLFDPKQEEIEGIVKNRGGRYCEEWKNELTSEWKRNSKAATADKVEPKTATERIHARIMDELRAHFEAFLTESTPEEQMILTEVLMDQKSNNRALTRDGFDQLPLGMAMEYALDKYTGEFLRVPYRLEKRVSQYIDCLMAADCKGVA